jgi:hypothetical protein
MRFALRKTMKLTTLTCSLFITVVACTSTTSTTAMPSDGGSTADATVNDAGAGAVDSGAGVVVACTQTAATACATAPADCPYPTFADARAAACCSGAGCIKVSSSPCGAYDVAEARGVDTATRHYFDPASGNLVAIVRYGASLVGGFVCGAGPASFDAPSCDPSTLVCVTGDVDDAGADAREGD